MLSVRVHIIHHQATFGTGPASLAFNKASGTGASMAWAACTMSAAQPFLCSCGAGSLPWPV